MTILLGTAILFMPAPVLPQTQYSDLDSVPIILPYMVFGHRDRINLLSFSPDGLTLASESFSDDVALSELKTSGVTRRFEQHGFAANSMLFSHDGKTLATGNNDGRVRLWDTTTLALKSILQVCRWSIFAIAFSPDDQILASDAADGRVQLWDLQTGQRSRIIGKYGERMDSIVFSPDGKLLATVDMFGRGDVWDVSTGESLATLPGYGRQNNIYFIENGQSVAIASQERVRVWDAQSGNLLRTVRLPDSIDLTRKLDFLPTGMSGRLIFTGELILSTDGITAASVLQDGNIALWDLESRKVWQLLTGFSMRHLAGGGVELIVFSSDGRLLASGSRNGVIQLWRID